MEDHSRMARLYQQPRRRPTPEVGGAVTLALRVLIGVVFLLAGALKVGHFDDLAAAIAGFRILPAEAIGPIAVLLPFFEIFVGLYLVTGLFTRAAAIAAAASLTVYAVAIASAVIRHIPANCGCFGPQDTATADWPHVIVDLAFAAVCALVAWRAPGLFAIDNRIRRT
jgi:uncharacterized membrane protein YphA (DoxX/SURF4 family)